jgi:hypothetical protein
MVNLALGASDPGKGAVPFEESTIGFNYAYARVYSELTHRGLERLYCVVKRK